MKQILAMLLVCWTASIASGAEAQWLVDLDEAKKKAQSEKKLVFINFTGSDWCPPCRLFKSRVADSEAFSSFAETNLILVEVDFPRRKPISEEQRASNEALAKEMNADRVVPTFVVLDSAGKEVKRFEGYGGEDSKEFIAKLAKLTK